MLRFIKPLTPLFGTDIGRRSLELDRDVRVVLLMRP